MDSYQLDSILSRNRFTQRYFLGVFASDRLPTRIRYYPACFIANVDPSSKGGSHWLAFFISSPEEVEFFDSYGNTPFTFNKFITNFAERFLFVNYNPMIIQSRITAVCGQHCLYYLYSKCRGYSLRQILPTYVTCSIHNDVKVYNFVANKFGVRTKFYQ